MKIKTKLLIVCITLAVVPAVLVALFTAHQAGSRSAEALLEEAESKLVAIRAAKRLDIDRYFSDLHKRVSLAALNPAALDAMKEFKSALGSLNTLTSRESELLDFYQSDFGAKYSEFNPTAFVDHSANLYAMDEFAQELQYHFIVQNPHPLGEKSALVESEGAEAYSVVHARYHEFFRQIQEQTGFYDLYLIDKRSGRVLYSAAKDVDFGTRLKRGPFANTALSDAFEAALELEEGQTFQTAFEAYAPNFDGQVSFIGTPIYARGRVQGVLVAKLAVTRINEVMTFGGRWSDIGLGETGESYLVGSNGTLRSDRRTFVESPEAFADRYLAGSWEREGVIARNTAVGVVKVNNPAVERAQQGETGVVRYTDGQGVERMAAYSPLEVSGRPWALVAEFTMEEASVKAEAIRQDSQLFALVGAAFAVVLGILAGGLISKTLSRPITRISRRITEIGRSNDLTLRVTVDSQDELGDMAEAVNQMMDSFGESFRKIDSSAQALDAAAGGIAVSAEQSAGSVQRLQRESDEVAAAVNQLNASAASIEAKTAHATTFTNDAKSAMSQGHKVVVETVGSIEQLAGYVNEANSVVSALKSDAENIGQVVDVINQIAEQTNLLALNAAIEAARAGEHGRGFAVVADEVRSLAVKTQTSTEAIKTMIDTVQNGADKAAQSMEQSQAKAKSGSELASLTAVELDRVRDAVEEITRLSNDIAASAREQSVASEQAQLRTGQIVRANGDSAQAAQANMQASQKLSSLATELKQSIGRFTL